MNIRCRLFGHRPFWTKWDDCDDVPEKPYWFRWKICDRCGEYLEERRTSAPSRPLDIIES
jgi:hypothetical protein